MIYQINAKARTLPPPVGRSAGPLIKIRIIAFVAFVALVALLALVALCVMRGALGVKTAGDRRLKKNHFTKAGALTVTERTIYHQSQSTDGHGAGHLSPKQEHQPDGIRWKQGVPKRHAIFYQGGEWDGPQDRR